MAKISDRIAYYEHRRARTPKRKKAIEIKVPAIVHRAPPKRKLNIDPDDLGPPNLEMQAIIRRLMRGQPE